LLQEITQVSVQTKQLKQIKMQGLEPSNLKLRAPSVQHERRKGSAIYMIRTKK